MPAFVTRFLSHILLATSAFVMLALIFIGYEVAILLAEAGAISGRVALLAIAGFPSLFALGSLPFWLVLRRMSDKTQLANFKQERMQ